MKILSLFSGIGAFEKALQRLDIPVELVGYSEVDKYAIKSYQAIWGEDKINLGDVTQINEKTLPKDIDLITYGFPCVPKGFKVKTIEGYKKIEDISANDMVLTHNNHYQKVVITMNRLSDHINIIKGVGCYNLSVTDEHPIYTYRNNDFCWVKAKNLTIVDKIVYNINTNNYRKEYSNDTLWLLGRYCADGYMENHSKHRPIFCIGSHKIEEFESHIVDFKYVINHSKRSCVEYKFLDDELYTLIKEFGTGALEKQIPNWIVDLPSEQLRYFLDGYLSGDGHKRRDRKLTMFCTINENMFLSLQEIIIKVHHVVPTVSVRTDNRKETYSNTYNAQFSLNPKNQLIIDNKILVDIKSIERIEQDIEVFNFEVENDNSYTVNNVIVHNCQDISLAGKTKGFYDEEGNRTRSGLFFEALRIIEHTQPKVAIAENVKNLTGKKFKKEFEIVLSSLEEAGYNNYWQVLNAKHYGVPQNRERVFIISIRKDVDTGLFQFPEKIPLIKRLKDILEPSVEEKYYLSDRLIETLLKHKERHKELGNGFGCDICKPEEVETCGTIQARYYKDGSDCLIDETDPKLHVYCNLYNLGIKGFNRDMGEILDPSGICKTLQTMQGGNRQPKIVEFDARAVAMRGRYNSEGEVEQHLEISDRDYANAVTTVQKDSLVGIIDDTQGFDGVRYYDEYSPSLRASRSGLKTVETNLRIRKLTPKECWRLMNFDDEDFEKAQKVNSNTQLYKQAGNSIVVAVLEFLFKELKRAEIL